MFKAQLSCTKTLFNMLQFLSLSLFYCKKIKIVRDKWRV